MLQVAPEDHERILGRLSSVVPIFVFGQARESVGPPWVSHVDQVSVRITDRVPVTDPYVDSLSLVVMTSLQVEADRISLTEIATGHASRFHIVLATAAVVTDETIPHRMPKLHA